MHPENLVETYTIFCTFFPNRGRTITGLLPQFMTKLEEKIDTCSPSNFVAKSFPSMCQLKH